tara:strand:- start:2825 stop:3739 length:915 start_codon:yes stop_codon:yes gene_type:complete
MKGIILAGGTGSRLYPLTSTVNKQLLPVHDKPLIYYPLTTLISSGIKDICIVAKGSDLAHYRQLLGLGQNFGINLSYFVQDKPTGIPQAFPICRDFIGNDNVTLILGDNIFVDSGEIRRTIQSFKTGSTIFSYQVKNPSRFGVVEFDGDGLPQKLVEKPTNTKSRSAIPGLYIYDPKVIFLASSLKSSFRGETEITDLNNLYLSRNELTVNALSRGTTWIDAGTPSALSRATNYIFTIETNHGLKIGCPEEAALIRGLIDETKLEALISNMHECEYKQYLTDLVFCRRNRASLGNGEQFFVQQR